MTQQPFALSILVLSVGLGGLAAAAGCGDDGGNVAADAAIDAGGSDSGEGPETPDGGNPAQDSGIEPDPEIDLSCLKLRQLRGYTVSPSAIAQLFTVETCVDGIPVPGLETDDFDIAEEGMRLSSEADAEFQKSTGLRVYVSLVLDMSSSTFPTLDDLILGANAFVTELLETRKLTNVMIGIDVFDGSATLQKWLLPTSDPVRLRDKIAKLSPKACEPADVPDEECYVNEDASSTNLNGAARDAVTQLQQRQIQVINANDNGVVTVGYMVLFTDGADTASRVTTEEASRTLASARFVNSSSTQVQATVTTYAVALAGLDYTRGSLEMFLSGNTAGGGDPSGAGACSNECMFAYTDTCDDGRVGSASSFCPAGTDCADCGPRAETSSPQSSEEISGDRFVFQADSPSALKPRFAELAGAISRQLEGTYLLAYCSPKRMGEYTLSLNVKESVSADSTGYEFPFSASGFGPGCSTEFFDTVCEEKDCGGFNCGACDDETEVCNAVTDTCESGCLGRNSCGGETFTNALGYTQVCNVDPDFEQCGGFCTDTSDSQQHCGECNHPCSSEATCTGGECECPTAGESSCPSGCFDLQADESNCGICGNYCPSSITCASGRCDCGGGELGCFGSCIDPTTNGSNCGTCGNQCPSGSTCTSSECVCTDGALTACATSCVDTETNSLHCGECDNGCGAGDECVDSVCASCVDGTMPGGTTAIYNGAATAPRDVTDPSCGTLSAGAHGVAIAWTAPATGYYQVTLASAGSLSGYVRVGGCAGIVQTCLSMGTAAKMSASIGDKFVFYVGSTSPTASAFTLSVSTQVP